MDTIFIIRIKLQNKIMQFLFKTKDALECAIREFKGIRASWFAAEVSSNELNGKRGKIIYQHKHDFINDPTTACKTLQWGAYKDTIYRTYFDDKAEAKRYADDVNSKVKCWADIHASPVKTIWFDNAWSVICYVDETDPYKD